MNKKIIFISTDHVFDGTKGNYLTCDSLNPLSKYAKTKTAAELLVRTYDNSMIIRTSFFGYEFPYESAFIDQWSSKDYVDIIAPKIIKLIKSNKVGIFHVGEKRKTIFEIAKRRSPNVGKISRSDIFFKTPKDTSLEETYE